MFQAVLENAVRICEAKFGTIYLFDGNSFVFGADVGTTPEYGEFQRRRGPFQPMPGTHFDRILQTKQVSHSADAAAEPVKGPVVTIGGARSFVGVPMIKDDVLVGAIGIYRREVRPFTDKHIELVKNFAAQAVIAIEDTRLLNELRQRTDDLTEALEQQTATSEVLKVISSSPGELEPVFNAILKNATRLCDAKFGNLFLYRDGRFYPTAMLDPPPALAEHIRKNEWQGFVPEPGVGLGRVLRAKGPVHVLDDRLEPHPGPACRYGGARSLVAVPMLKEDKLVGAFIIYRQEVRAFTDKQIELVTNFAAQAVIAIENTRLLNELRQRTDDLSESLEQQTATSEVLQVISSSPGDLNPVFESILANATRICEAGFGNLWLREGAQFRAASTYGAPAHYWAQLQKQLRPTPGTLVARVIETRQPVQAADMSKSQAYRDGDPVVVASVDIAGTRTLVSIPMLKDDELVGVMAIYRREVRPFTDKQIELLQNFAAQAVIAIENTRLLNELRQRTDDLSESLEQQTATSEVLKVISSSPGDLQPVFEATLANAVHLCGAKFGALSLREGEAFRSVVLHGASPALAEYRQKTPLIRVTPGHNLERLVRTKSVVHIADLSADRAAAPIPFEVAGARALLNVPLLKGSELIGSILIYRHEVGPFSEKQIELVKNFAAQAVIAIENARLLNELRESLEQQTATSEVLSVISSSQGELEPVFRAMLGNATRICGAQFGNLFLREGRGYRAVAVHGEQEYRDYWQRDPMLDIGEDPDLPMARVTRTKSVVHIVDLEADKTYSRRNSRIVALVETAGARTFLAVPMLKDNELIGSIAMYRQERLAFTEKQIDLVKNFAAQAVIAIENTRLLNELRQIRSQQQTATADVLKVISRSTFDLQTVLRHIGGVSHQTLRS